MYTEWYLHSINIHTGKCFCVKKRAVHILNFISFFNSLLVYWINFEMETVDNLKLVHARNYIV